MSKSRNLIKRLFWLYFILLLIEGGLRRWIFPDFSNFFLIVRDPFAIIILIVAFKNNLVPKNKYLSLVILVSILSFYTALFFGHGNLLVAVYGSRILLLHFPLIFIFGNILDQDDLVLFGKVILLISIPMAILITIQFYSPQSAWVNRGVGGSLEGAGFSGTADYFRPPGTFSFITGVTSFFTIVGCFVFYFWINTKMINFPLLISSTIAFLVSIPTSISRTLFFSVFITFICFLLAKSTQKDFFKNASRFIFGIFIIFLIFSNTSILNNQINAFTERFRLANDVESKIKSGADAIQDVIINRLIYSTFQDIKEDYILFGKGVGAGTNVGAKLLTGNVGFIVAEGEIARIFGEYGLILGLIIVFIRIRMSYEYSLKSYNLFRAGDQLPFMIFSIGFINTFIGAWAQPNALGFYVIISSIWIASMKPNLNVPNAK